MNNKYNNIIAQLANLSKEEKLIMLSSLLDINEPKAKSKSKAKAKSKSKAKAKSKSKAKAKSTQPSSEKKPAQAYTQAMLEKLKNHTDKVQMVNCGKNLYLSITPGQVKTYRVRYSNDDKKQISKKLGTFEALSLAQARQKTDNFTGSNKATFGDIADDFFNIFILKTGKTTIAQVKAYMKIIKKFVGHKLPHELEKKHWKAVFDHYESRGATSQRKRIRHFCSRVIQWANIDYPNLKDYPKHLNTEYKQHEVNHKPAILNPAELADYLIALTDNRSGEYVTRAALLFLINTMVRPGNVQFLKWNYIDFKRRVITYPGQAMKATGSSKISRDISKQAHIVYMNDFVFQLLHDLKKITGHHKYVFVSAKYRHAKQAQPICKNTMPTFLKKTLNFKNRHSPHGSRATARSLLGSDFFGYNESIINLQLGHCVKDTNGKAYNRSEAEKTRENMLSVWGLYLKSIIKARRAGEEITLDYEAFFDFLISRNIMCHDSSRFSNYYMIKKAQTSQAPPQH